ncbi:MAG: hypothetical protein AAFV80_14260 [Bacteroidota bacterium]
MTKPEYPRLAVIDLGTNTFHMLIVEVFPDFSFREIYRDPEYVYLAEEGIDTIGEAPFQRGLATLTRFKQQLDKHQVKATRVFGTEALRKASNGPLFRKLVKQQTGIDIELITGLEEARLIAQGTRMAVPPFEETILTMDIGGGSVEFILMNQDEVLWKQSFPIGISVLYRQFQQTEPISAAQIQIIFEHLNTVLKPLTEELKKHEVNILAGASGAFEIVQAALNIPQQKPDYAEIDRDSFLEFTRPMYRLDLDERKAHPLIPTSRAQLFVVALLLNDWSLQATGAQRIWMSKYAMKEGMLWGMMRDESFL